MPGLFDAPEPKVTWVDQTKTIVPPAVVGLLFVLIGYTKFNGDPRGEWYQTFERIGIGQWFRIFTGVMQIAGGLLMCVPKTMVYGAAMLTCTGPLLAEPVRSGTITCCACSDSRSSERDTRPLTSTMASSASSSEHSA